MKNKTYDILKEVALTVLPAIATFLVTLGNIWSIPFATEISASITALDAFLGAVLHISNKNYNKNLLKEGR